MNNEILKAVIEEASALASSLPEGIQPTAFAKAFDILLEQRAMGEKRHRQAKQAAPRRRSSSEARPTSRSRRVGPKFALGQLLDGGYFATARTLPEIQAYLKDSHGHDYGSNELSISLLRLIRDARLVREKNLAGQYEYWVPGKASEGPAHEGKLQPAKAHTRLLTDGKGAMK
jgi:hypothetical protein